MATYSVAQIENLTGITAHTLRMWERRYSFVKAKRSESNIRFYTDEQLRQLLNIGVLVKNGVRVSRIDQMQESEINDLVRDIMTQTSDNDSEIRMLIKAMLDYDEPSFINIFQMFVDREGLLNSMTELIYPFLKQTGVLWGTNKVMPAQEHFVSNLIRQKLLSFIDALPQVKSSAPSILLFLPEGEMHEISLLIAYYIAKQSGWNVIYLGQNVPFENIESILESKNFKAILSMLIRPVTDDILNNFSKISQKSGVSFLLSGKPNNMMLFQDNKAFTIIDHPLDLVKFLKGVK